MMKLTYDVYTNEIAMPTTIRSYVIALADGNYCIVLNSNLNFESRMKAYDHEMRHIKNGDYEKHGDIDIIEINCHKED